MESLNSPYSGDPPDAAPDLQDLLRSEDILKVNLYFFGGWGLVWFVFFPNDIRIPRKV